MRKLVSLVGVVLFVGACSSGTVPGVSPVVTVPPITLPSNLPTMPDLGLPTPVGGLSPACQLVTQAEMTSMMGEPMAGSSSVATECSWSGANITPTVIIRYDTGESIAGAKLAFPGGRDLTIGGSAAYYSDTASALYIEKGGRSLVLQAVWSLAGPEAYLKLAQIGELAASRF